MKNNQLVMLCRSLHRHCEGQSNRNDVLAVVIMLLTLINLLQSNVIAQCFEPQNVMQSGEKLYYDGYYNLSFIWINAGYATFSVDNVMKDNEKMYKISAVGGSHKGYDFIFKIRDTIDVFVDTSTLEPKEYRQITNEGSYTAEHHYKFDNKNRKINMRIQRDKRPVETKTIDWKYCSYDILSMAYIVRSVDFSKYKENEKIPVNLVVDGEIHELYIRYKGKEIIKNKDGKTYRCLKFSPLLVEGTIFNSGEDMTVWVTDDKSRVPVIVEAKILIGSVKAIFTGAEGLKYPIEAEIIE
jgi:hypothetical protein